MTSNASEFAAAREAMVESQLRPQGVTDRQVIAAMGSIPREDYVPDEARAIAYTDRIVPLGEGRALAPPAALGALLTELAPVAGERALVVGTATAYSAAVLEAMGVAVTRVEGADAAALEAGDPKNGEYDIILIDGAAGFIPDALVGQLAPQGRLGGGLSEGGVTRLIIGRKAGSAFGYRSIGDAAMPRLPGFTRPSAFTF